MFMCLSKKIGRFTGHHSNVLKMMPACADFVLKTHKVRYNKFAFTRTHFKLLILSTWRSSLTQVQFCKLVENTTQILLNTP